MVRLFQVLAVILIGAAGYFYWGENPDGAFAAAVAAICSFLISVRFQIKSRMKSREAEAATETTD